MNFSPRRVNALVTKEIRDFCKNPNVLVMLLFSLGVTIFYRKALGAREANGYLVAICLNMNITTIGCMVIAMLIAEEKEKNTLRTLMLSPLTVIEFIIGKFIITGIVIMITNIVIFFILKINIIYLPSIFIVSLLTTISILFVGAIIGLFSKDQMQTGIIGTPFYMILFIIPMFTNYKSYPDILKKIAYFLPTYHCSEFIYKIMNGQNFMAVKFNCLALVLWIIGAFIVFSIIYKRNRLLE